MACLRSTEGDSDNDDGNEDKTLRPCATLLPHPNTPPTIIGAGLGVC